MFNLTELKNGDRVFIFVDLPGTPNNLPFPIAKGIQLIMCPCEYWNNEDILKSYRFIFPFANFGISCDSVSVCISQEIDKQDETFWLFLLALRLIKPLPIHVSGAFTYRDKKIDESSLSLLWRKTLINSGFPHKTGQGEDYSNSDFEAAKDLYNRIQYLKQHPRLYRRLFWAITWFQEITLGTSTSYSMLYQGLFSSLEALFGSPADGKKLKKLTSNFLTNIYGNKQANMLGEFIGNQYEEKRNAVSHGNPSFHSPINVNAFLSLKKYKELLKLHEIVRVILIGFLGWHKIHLKEHSKVEFGLHKLGEFNNFFKNKKASTLYKKIYLRIPYISSRKRKT